MRYAPSGTYFARFKVGGKLIRKSLKTKVFSVAELRLPDEIKEHRKLHEARKNVVNGKMAVGEAVQIYKESLDANPQLKPRSKAYYRLMLDFIERSWPRLFETDIREVSDRDCQSWIQRYKSRYAPSVVNNSIGVLRAVFAEAVSVGARFGNPASSLKRMKLKKKMLRLPTRAQFLEFVTTIGSGGSRDSKNCADLVRLLAYSGMRVGESKFVTWADVDFAGNRLHVHGNPETGTKNSESRAIPMIPELHKMLEQLRAERPTEPRSTQVMRIHECQKSMDRAAKIVGMDRITHHDLRHLFATISIESGVDIPTVSRWLGHKDGGALCMKTYGHLRDEHSKAQAQRVKFGP